MSSDALDIYESHRAYQVESGVFSESFLPTGGTKFEGIWDQSHIEENKDRGNVNQMIIFPRIIVTEIPAGLAPGMTVITRIRTGEAFTFRIGSIDDEGVNLLWLV